jgi:hypothetical protein
MSKIPKLVTLILHFTLQVLQAQSMLQVNLGPCYVVFHKVISVGEKDSILGQTHIILILLVIYPISHLYSPSSSSYLSVRGTNPKIIQ